MVRASSSSTATTSTPEASSSPTAASAHGFSPQSREAREASEIGRRIADRYQIEQVLREDELTSTVLARHLALEERVVVQVLRPEQRFDARISAQYLDAAKALARIKSSHVARVVDLGVALYLGPFLVLEALEGKTLAQVLGEDGPLPEPRAVSHVLQACKGLAVAHAAGVVHGQLHLGRLLLARRGEFETLEVIDFPTLDRATATAEQKGYLAPELMSGALPADRRADVWSLGAVLYELVTGKSPFAAASAEERLHEAALSPALRGIVARCLQAEPEQRFADVDELAAELLPLTTMNEVFRGSLTGSFSRQMMMAAAAQARAAASVPRAPAQRGASGAGRARLGSVLPLQRWSERWSSLAQRWQARMPPEAPALSHSLLGGGVLLLGLACSWLGDVDLLPPPPRYPSTLTVQTAALRPAPEPAAPAAAEPVAELPAAEPAAAEGEPPAALAEPEPPPAPLLFADGAPSPTAAEATDVPSSDEGVVAKPARAKKERRAAARRATASKRATSSESRATERAARRAARSHRRASQRAPATAAVEQPATAQPSDER